MAIKVPNDGELGLLNVVIDESFNATQLNCGLFQTNYTPVDGDVLADYTAIEADFDGYAQQALGVFLAATLVGGKAYTACPTLLWIPTGGVTPNDIYGFFVWRNSDNVLFWAGRFTGAPIVVTGPGTPVTYTATFTLRSES